MANWAFKCTVFLLVRLFLLHLTPADSTLHNYAVFSNFIKQLEGFFPKRALFEHLGFFTCLR